MIPLYNTPQEYLRKLLQSITAQSYGKFELCLADGSTKKGPAAFVKKFYGNDPRIRLKHLRLNAGISENTNEAIRMATGEFLMFADHDDFLEPDAHSYEMVRALNKNRELDLIYTDEDLCDEKGERFFAPRMKPDFNPDFLRSINYICHLVLVRRSLAEEVGLLRKQCDGAQDYDFLLRCIEKTDRVVSYPEGALSLESFRNSPRLAIRDGKTYAIDAGKLALTEHYARLGYEAEVEYTGIFIMYRMRLKLKSQPLVTILIPNKDQAETLANCLDSIYEKTDYPHFFEITCGGKTTVRKRKPLLIMKR
ncbi:MAG: glycosyltransferase [Blautia sp.]